MNQIAPGNALTLSSIGLRLVCCLMVSGCASRLEGLSTSSNTSRESLGTVAVAPAHFVPRGSFSAFAKGWTTGASDGLKAGAELGAVEIAAASTVAGPMAPITMIIAAIHTALVTGVATLQGALKAVPVDIADKMDAAIKHRSKAADLQRLFAERIAKLEGLSSGATLPIVDEPQAVTVVGRPNYSGLGQRGIDTVLEVMVEEFGLDSCKSDMASSQRREGVPCEGRNFRFYLNVNIRLIRTSDGLVIDDQKYRYTSPPRQDSLWVENDGQLLAQEFEHSYNELADRVHADIFLASAANYFSSSPRFRICGIAPMYPPVEPAGIEKVVSDMVLKPFSKTMSFCASPAFSSIDNRSPTLRWSTFPPVPIKSRGTTQDFSEVQSVSYDLKIWESDDCDRGALVYSRTGLPSAEHSLETPLAPERGYHWTVRARFSVHGERMVTPWAFYNESSCLPYGHSGTPTGRTYFRFMTPAAPENSRSAP